MKDLKTRYMREKENGVAFELLNRYRQVPDSEKGEIIWTLLSPHRADLAKIVVGMRENPDDELQKLYIKLHQLFMRDKFPYKNWKAWLARILRNDLLNKKNQKNLLVAMPVEVLPEVETEEVEERLPLSVLEKAVARLAPTQQEVIKLRYFGGKEGKLMTYKEIATKMDCSVGQVHGYLDRAKENLRNHLNGQV
ncbi:MAG: RNA polymerase sigma factor [Bacteroidota bacterium]